MILNCFPTYFLNCFIDRIIRKFLKDCIKKFFIILKYWYNFQNRIVKIQIKALLTFVLLLGIFERVITTLETIFKMQFYKICIVTISTMPSVDRKRNLSKLLWLLFWHILKTLLFTFKRFSNCHNVGRIFPSIPTLPDIV